MSNYEHEEEENQLTLVDQLGTDQITLAKGRINKLLTMYLVGSDQIPDQTENVVYWKLRELIVDQGMSFTKAINIAIPDAFNATGGRGQNMLVKAQTVKNGGVVNTEAPPPQPSIFQRLVGADEAKEYQLYKERQEAGLE